MAATASLSFSFSLDPLRHLFSSNTHFLIPSLHLPKQHSITFSHNSTHHSFKSSSSLSSSSSSSSSTSSTATTATSPTPSFLEAPLRTGRFLSNEDLEKLKFVENFRYYQELESGSMWVRVMRSDEMDIIVGLLAESMLLPKGYVSLLGFLVKQNLMERRELMPHTATLIEFYRSNHQDESFESKNGNFEVNDEDFDDDDEVGVLAGTVEVCFDKKGANASTPSPIPPKNSPYIYKQHGCAKVSSEEGHWLASIEGK